MGLQTYTLVEFDGLGRRRVECFRAPSDVVALHRARRASAGAPFQLWRGDSVRLDHEPALGRRTIH